MYQPPPEFQRLRQSIEKSGFTQSTWIGLVGPSASGKTAAARQLISELQATDQQLQVLVGRCSENSTPFQPFREALEELGVSAALIASRAQGGDVNSIFDRLADELIPFWDFFSSEGGDEEKNGPVRDDLRAAVTNALLTFAKRQPVLLFLDDIQWLDEDSAMLLKHLRENFAPGRETPLIIIVASRDPQPLERLELKDSVFSLTPPSSTEQVQILENSLGIENASARRLVDALGVMSQEAGGMFWLIRAVRELAAANAFEPTSRGLKLQARYLRSGELPVPAAMRAKLMESVRASGDLQPVLECAALLGERFRVNDLAECLDMSRLTLLQILRHLERELQLVRDIPSDQECYAFSSTFLLQIVRDELGAGNSHSKRPASKIAREFHVRIARVLERRQPRTLQLASSIADHYLAAGVSHAARSLDFCLGAARLARERHAFLDARKFLTMAEQSARLAGRSMNFSDERRRIDSEEAEMTGRNSSA